MQFAYLVCMEELAWLMNSSGGLSTDDFVHDILPGWNKCIANL